MAYELYLKTNNETRRKEVDDAMNPGCFLLNTLLRLATFPWMGSQREPGATRRPKREVDTYTTNRYSYINK